MRSAIIHSDGSCYPNPGPGGWAAVISVDGEHSEISGQVLERTTNNRMELTAAIQGLMALEPSCEVLIITDSEYLRKGAVEKLPAWRRWNWTRRAKGSDHRVNVVNVDLWQEIDRLQQLHKVTWEWVRGHGKCAENRRADFLANQARTRKL